MNGKGDNRRPMQISQKQFAINWDKTFNGQSQDQDETSRRREGQGKSKFTTVSNAKASDS